MNNPIIYAPLTSRRLQAIRQDNSNGDLYIHTSQGFVYVTVIDGRLAHSFVPRAAKPEVLVIPAKESSRNV